MMMKCTFVCLTHCCQFISPLSQPFHMTNTNPINPMCIYLAPQLPPFTSYLSLSMYLHYFSLRLVQISPKKQQGRHQHIHPVHSKHINRPTFVATHILLRAGDDICALDNVEESALVWLVHSDTPVMVHEHSALLLLTR